MGILTFKRQLSIADQLLNGDEAGSRKTTTTTYIRSPRAITIMNHSDNVRILGK